MEQFEKLRERLNDALAKIDSAMEAVSENKEDANLSSSLMSENLGLKSQVKALDCLLYTSPSPRDKRQSRMPSSA